MAGIESNSSNPQLTLLNIFPVVTRQWSSLDIQLAKFCGQPVPQPIRYNHPIDLIKAVIEDEGLKASGSAIEDTLRQSKIYKEWQKAMPKLKDVPGIHTYRVKPKHQVEISQVSAEVLANGGYLQKGQLLFRGGDFKKHEITNEYGPTSTSMSPAVARWHAVKVTGEIALLRIADDNAVKAFAFRTSGNQRLKHEYEVLLQNNLRFKQTARSPFKNFQIVDYDVYLI